MRIRLNVLTLFVLCLFVAGCAAKKAHIAAPAAEMQPPPQSEVTASADGDNETGQVIPLQDVRLFAERIEHIDARYYPLLSRSTKYLTALDSYLAAHDTDLFADQDVQPGLRKAYRDIYEKFGRFYTTINEYALWCEREFPGVEPLQQVGREALEDKKKSLADFERRLNSFQRLPDHIDRLFSEVKNR